MASSRVLRSLPAILSVISVVALSLVSSAPLIDCGNSKLTNALRQTLLDQHNARRSNISLGKQPKAGGGFAPTAKNMYQLTWSCDLEMSAQRWADKCAFAHSAAAERGNAGENLYWTWGTGDMSAATRLPQAAPAWWQEYIDLGPITDPGNRLTLADFNKGIGHWTQMAWGATTQLGCGFGACKNSGFPSAYVVCHYRNPGNIISQPIYELGSACSKDTDCTSISSSTCLVASGLCTLSAQ